MVTKNKMLIKARKIRAKTPSITRNGMERALEEQYLGAPSGKRSAMNNPLDLIVGVASMAKGLYYLANKKKKQAIKAMIQGVLRILF